MNSFQRSIFAGAALLLGCCGLLPFSAFSADSPDANAPLGLRHERIRHQDMNYDVVWVDTTQADLRLLWKRPDGEPHVNFRNLARWCEEHGETLVFATNAGIYAKDRTPLGLYVAAGEMLRPLNKGGGGGNFFMKPNGVFFIEAQKASILAANEYDTAARSPILAVQSGPLLLNRGAIHHRFIPDSDSRFVRNGVGVDDNGLVVFAISLLPVNFQDFALLFRDRLNCADALYLDGSISGMYAPFAGRQDIGLEYVGMLAVTEKRTP